MTLVSKHIVKLHNLSQTYVNDKTLQTGVLGYLSLFNNQSS